MRFGFRCDPGFAERDLFGPWAMTTIQAAGAGGPNCVTRPSGLHPFAVAQPLLDWHLGFPQR